MIAFVLTGMVAGLIAGVAALFLGHSFSAAVAVYSLCGMTTVLLVLVRAWICLMIGSQVKRERKA